jgi:3-oxoacyl-[acyl-carrier protein] reductase
MLSFKKQLVFLSLSLFIVRSAYAANKAEPLSKQLAIVWGASQGIGAAIAKRLGSEGAHVFLLARNEENLKKVTMEIRDKGGKADYFVADITDEAKVNSVTKLILDKHQRIDILVQNVGVYPRMNIEDMTGDFFRKVMDINVTSNIYVIKAVLPAMKQANYGRILLVSSITGNITGIPGLSAYSASKGAMTGLVKGLALELAPFHITINTIEPGYIITEGLNYLSEDYMDKIAKSVPLGRAGTAEEVASMSFFMVHPDASYMTGKSLVVDGGLTLPESHYLHVRGKP